MGERATYVKKWAPHAPRDPRETRSLSVRVEEAARAVSGTRHGFERLRSVRRQLMLPWFPGNMTFTRSESFGSGPITSPA